MVGRCMKVSIGATISTGTVLLILGVVLGFKVFPDAVKEQVSEKVLLNYGTEAWGLWEKLPIPMNFKVYFFNVTNIDDINNGALPIVNEIGPYIYDEYKEKVDIVVHEDNGTASYYQRTTFKFNQEASGHLSDTDNVTILHVAMMGIVEVAEMMGILGLLSHALSDLFFNPKDIFLTASVKDLLFDGVTINCQGFMASLACDQIRQNKPSTIKDDPDNNLVFSFFSHKNETFDGYYEVKLGWSDSGSYPSVEGAKQLGKIVKWENSSMLNTWTGDKCNEILGTDAAIFPPFLDEDSRIDIFSTDLCRSLYAVYDRKDNYKGIDSMRYIAQEILLSDVNGNPDNYCYCPPDNACLLRGALDLTPCQGAPVILTFPHFYLASEEYLKMMGGVKPVRELHETFLELEPNTGLPLRGGKRVQFNLMMKKYSNIEMTKNVSTALFPIFWIDEGLELDDHNVNRIKDELVNTLNILTGVTWALIGVGIALIVIGFGLILWVRFRSNTAKTFSTN